MNNPGGGGWEAGAEAVLDLEIGKTVRKEWQWEFIAERAWQMSATVRASAKAKQGT